MKRVQITAGAFHALQCFRDGAHGFDRRVVYLVGAQARIRLYLSHGVEIPVSGRVHRLCVELPNNGNQVGSNLSGWRDIEPDVKTRNRREDRDGQLPRYTVGVVETWDRLARPVFAAIEARQAGDQGCVDVEHALSRPVSRSLQRLPMPPPNESACVDSLHAALQLLSATG